MKTKCNVTFEKVMRKWKKTLVLVVIVLTCSNVTAQSYDSLFHRHSIQFNAAGLSFERWGVAYEIRLNPRHAISISGGGSFPFISEEKEYGLQFHYKYFLQPAFDKKFLWLFKSAYRNTFWDFNIRYMNLDGVHDGSEYLFNSTCIGAGIGQNWVWNSGFTVSYWIGYGPPVSSDFSWKNTIPEDGDSWADMYNWASGLDFGLAFGYSFGKQKSK